MSELPQVPPRCIHLHGKAMAVYGEGFEDDPDYQEADGQRVMKQSEITVRVQLARGEQSATVWTCDLSHDYVSINADYRS